MRARLTARPEQMPRLQAFVETEQDVNDSARRALTVGGNFNYNPGYTTRTSDVQWLTVSQKRVLDVYGLWRVDNTTSWRLTLSNLDPRYYNTGSLYSSPSVVENSQTQNRSWTSVQIRLEKKL